MSRLFVVCAFVIIAGCSTDPEQASAPTSASSPVRITCQAGTDCDAKWSRAGEWVTKNSVWGIQSRTDLLIQTSSSINDSPSPGFKVTKVAASEPGTYEITFTGRCSNMWGCMPTVAAERARFADFVAGVPAQTALARTMPAPTTPAQVIPAPTIAAQPASAQTVPVQTAPAQSAMLWSRRDQQQITGNPALENQIQFDRYQCQANASKDGQPSN